MPTPKNYAATHSVGETVAPHATATIEQLLSEDINQQSAKLLVDGVERPTGFTFDFANNRITVLNLSDEEWPSGTELEVTWEGTEIQAQVDDLEARVAALEAGA